MLNIVLYYFTYFKNRRITNTFINDFFKKKYQLGTDEISYFFINVSSLLAGPICFIQWHLTFFCVC